MAAVSVKRSIITTLRQQLKCRENTKDGCCFTEKVDKADVKLERKIQ